MNLVQIETPGKRIARVFARKTKATPEDSLAFYGPPPRLFDQSIDEVHIDVTFTADKAWAEYLAHQWEQVAPVKIGGVVYEREARAPIYPLDFSPGMYIKSGYVLTSRGCPRRCWFCGVWKIHPNATPINTLSPGWNILDDNLLACPEWHVRRVFQMLREQPRRAEFTGGLEAAALQDYQVGLLADLKPRPTCFFAYDPGDPFETLKSAAERMLAAGFTACSHRLRVYVLIGYPKDTLTLAEARMKQMTSIGFTPHAMLWQPETPSAQRYRPGPEWTHFKRTWIRPAIIHARRVA